VRLVSASRRSGLVVAVVAVVAALSVPAGTASATDDPDPRITAVMDKPAYETAQEGLLQVDSSSGRVARSQFPTSRSCPDR
jgi:D-alanyl-D-alanine carboxypeptidase/D-alanyl-D-alanine-endopeptidase (penicillin-binding protein 4)